MALVNKLVRNPNRNLELGVCERLVDRRTWISRHGLAKQPPKSIILIDHWQPSDAAFRRLTHRPSRPKALAAICAGHRLRFLAEWPSGRGLMPVLLRLLTTLSMTLLPYAVVAYRRP